MSRSPAKNPANRTVAAYALVELLEPERQSVTAHCWLIRHRGSHTYIDTAQTHSVLACGIFDLSRTASLERPYSQCSPLSYSNSTDRDVDGRRRRAELPLGAGIRRPLRAFGATRLKVATSRPTTLLE